MPGNPLSTYPFNAEVFLVEDTGLRDSTGKAIIRIFGGVRYGWQIQETTQT